MKDRDALAHELLEHITKWSRSESRLVVAVDGYASSGKTTLTSYVGSLNPQVLPVHLDDFIQHWKVRKTTIETAEDKASVFENKWYRYDVLIDLLKTYKSGKCKTFTITTYDYEKNDWGAEKVFDLTKSVLLLDGIFTLHPKHNEHKYIDKGIYLRGDFPMLDKLRIAREQKRWGQQYVPEDHPDNWTRYFVQAYKKYIKEYAIENSADCVINIE